MKEWFREFQVACERSEQVMQKSSKPARQLQYHSGARNKGYSGGIEQEEGIDSIRFCDVTSVVNREVASAGTASTTAVTTTGSGSIHTRDNAVGTVTGAGVAAMPIVPASMLEDVPLSVLLAQTVRFLFRGFSFRVVFIVFSMSMCQFVNFCGT